MKKRSADITCGGSPTSWKCHQQQYSQCDQCWGASKNIVLVHSFLKATSNTQSTSYFSCSLSSFDPSTVQCIVNVLLGTVFNWNFIINIETLHWLHFSLHSVNDFLFSVFVFDVIQLRFDQFQFFNDFFSVFTSRYRNISIDSGSTNCANRELRDFRDQCNSLTFVFPSVFIIQIVLSRPFGWSNLVPFQET